MNLYRRVIILFLKLYYRMSWFFGPKKSLHPEEAEVEMTFRVGPRDIDLNRHLNNGRLISIADLGKLELCAMVGLASPLFKGKLMAVVKEHYVDYKHSAPLFSKVKMISQIEGWDTERIYINHRFIRLSNNREIAVLNSACALLSSDGVQSPAEVYREYQGYLDMIGCHRSLQIPNIAAISDRVKQIPVPGRFVEQQNAA